MLAEEDPRDERRRSRRAPAHHHPASLRAGDLTLEGTILDSSAGGVFLATQLLIEVGERGVLVVDDAEIRVQVVWLRGNAHEHGPGMGLCFDDDPDRRDTIAGKLVDRAP